METKFWKPSLTSQFSICCIPYHLDTYRGCPHDCIYCFSRDFTTFSRRNSEHKEFTYLVGNDCNKFQRWVNRTLLKEIDYNKSEEVAFKERIPLKIGATSDPFPYIEEEEKITYGFLKTLKELDYPVQISTKNPEVFLKYSKDFIGMNLALNVTITTCNDEFGKILEPGAISPSRRFEAIKELRKQGFNILVRIQPFIYPYIMDEMEELVKRIKYCGAFGFQTEGLKYRVTMPEKERVIFQKIGDYLGFDIKEYFKLNGVITGSDREYKHEIKNEVLNKFQEYANKYELKFYNADNYLINGVGCGSECCGTECLRNYKIFGLNKRTLFYNEDKNFSEHLPLCKVNFTRSKRFFGKTLKEAMEIIKKK